MRVTGLWLLFVAKLILLPVFADSIASRFFTEKEKLIINIDPDFPPFEFVNDKGEADGFNVELIQEVMKRLNQPYEFHIADWDDILGEFRNGKSHLIAGISNTSARKSEMLFTIPHSEISLDIFSLKHRPIENMEMLKNKKVIVQNSDWAHDYLLKHSITDSITIVKRIQDGFLLLAEGKHAAFLCTDIVTSFTKTQNLVPKLHITRADIPPLPYSMAFRPEDEHLVYLVNRILYEIKMEGYIDALYNKWMGIYEQPYMTPIFIKMLVGFLLIAIVLVVFVFVLRRRVHKATNNLYASQNHLREVNRQLRLSLEAGRITTFSWYLKTNDVQISPDKSMRKKTQIDGKFKVDFNRFLQQFRPESEAEFFSLLERIKSGNVESGQIEIASTDNGETCYFDLNLIVHKKDANGDIEIIIGYIQDISDRKKSELALANAKERAERSDKFKSSFMANMSHEIRTPLNSIVGFSQLMRTAETDEEKDLYLNIIQENNNQLLKLINDVLDLSKIEAGYIEFIDKSFYLNEFFNELYERFLPLTSDKDVTLRWDNPLSDCFIEFDKERLNQIMSNLLNNAIKFTNYGYVKFGYEPAVDGVRFYVKDTGIGISEEYQEKIFERFEKVNSFAPGSGLGLSICKSIVESVEGQLHVSSNPGKGSLFEVFIPCTPELIKEKELQSLRIS